MKQKKRMLSVLRIDPRGKWYVGTATHAPTEHLAPSRNAVIHELLLKMVSKGLLRY
jgi:hypothetical protein